MVYRRFDAWFADFVQYSQNGYVHYDYVTPAGHHLGCWVHNIRNGKYKLTEEQKERLNNAGFIWKRECVKPAKAKRRNRLFEEWLDDFKKYSIDGDVPQRYVTPEGYRLGLWVCYIRQSMFQLPNEKIKKLDAVGFKWRVRATPKKRSFEEWYADFLRYNQDGHVHLRFVTHEGHSLGRWVKNVRLGRYKITEEQRTQLNDAGFIWQTKCGAPKKRSFEEWYADFLRYNQDGSVIATFVTPDGHKLGRWVVSVRNGAYTLTDEQKLLLNDAKFVWHGKRGARSKYKP